MSNFQQTVTRPTKEQESMAHTQKKQKQPIETVSEEAQTWNFRQKL